MYRGYGPKWHGPPTSLPQSTVPGTTPEHVLAEFYSSRKSSLNVLIKYCLVKKSVIVILKMKFLNEIFENENCLIYIKSKANKSDLKVLCEM